MIVVYLFNCCSDLFISCRNRTRWFSDFRDVKPCMDLTDGSIVPCVDWEQKKSLAWVRVSKTDINTLSWELIVWYKTSNLQSKRIIIYIVIVQKNIKVWVHLLEVLRHNMSTSLYWVLTVDCAPSPLLRAPCILLPQIWSYKAVMILAV
jgi:hypothetical protein